MCGKFGLRDAGLTVQEVAGLPPDLVRGGCQVGRDLWVNFLLAAERHGEVPGQPAGGHQGETWDGCRCDTA